LQYIGKPLQTLIFVIIVASEYRSFLLFYGAACLYGVLDQVYFDHFMLLSDAIWLLLQECITKQELEQATSKLQYFCFQMATLYGNQYFQYFSQDQSDSTLF
jgi:hypothetical protein